MVDWYGYNYPLGVPSYASSYASDHRNYIVDAHDYFSNAYICHDSAPYTSLNLYAPMQNQNESIRLQYEIDKNKQLL